MSHRDLSCAERAKILTGIATRQIELMAKYVNMLAGENLPALVLSREIDGKPFDVGFTEELYTFMSSINDSLNWGAVPIGYLYESADGFVREPFTPGNEGQIKQLTEYEKLEREKRERRERSAQSA